MSRFPFGRNPDKLKSLGGSLVIGVTAVGEQDAVRWWHSPKDIRQQFAVSFQIADKTKTEHRRIVDTIV